MSAIKITTTTGDDSPGATVFLTEARRDCYVPGSRIVLGLLDPEDANGADLGFSVDALRGGIERFRWVYRPQKTSKPYRILRTGSGLGAARLALEGTSPNAVNGAYEILQLRRMPETSADSESWRTLYRFHVRVRVPVAQTSQDVLATHTAIPVTVKELRHYEFVSDARDTKQARWAQIAAEIRAEGFGSTDTLARFPPAEFYDNYRFYIPTEPALSPTNVSYARFKARQVEPTKAAYTNFVNKLEEAITTSDLQYDVASRSFILSGVPDANELFDGVFPRPEAGGKIDAATLVPEKLTASVFSAFGMTEAISDLTARLRTIAARLRRPAPDNLDPVVTWLRWSAPSGTRIRNHPPTEFFWPNSDGTSTTDMLALYRLFDAQTAGPLPFFALDTNVYIGQSAETAPAAPPYDGTPATTFPPSNTRLKIAYGLSDTSIAILNRQVSRIDIVSSPAFIATNPGSYVAVGTDDRVAAVFYHDEAPLLPDRVVTVTAHDTFGVRGRAVAEEAFGDIFSGDVYALEWHVGDRMDPNTHLAAPRGVLHVSFPRKALPTGKTIVENLGLYSLWAVQDFGDTLEHDVAPDLLAPQPYPILRRRLVQRFIFAVDNHPTSMTDNLAVGTPLRGDLLDPTPIQTTAQFGATGQLIQEANSALVLDQWVRYRSDKPPQVIPPEEAQSLSTVDEDLQGTYVGIVRSISNSPAFFEQAYENAFQGIGPYLDDAKRMPSVNALPEQHRRYLVSKSEACVRAAQTVVDAWEEKNDTHLQYTGLLGSGNEANILLITNDVKAHRRTHQNAVRLLALCIATTAQLRLRYIPANVMGRVAYVLQALLVVVSVPPPTQVLTPARFTRGNDLTNFKAIWNGAFANHYTTFQDLLRDAAPFWAPHAARVRSSLLETAVLPARPSKDSGAIRAGLVSVVTTANTQNDVSPLEALKKFHHTLNRVVLANNSAAVVTAAIRMAAAGLVTPVLVPELLTDQTERSVWDARWPGRGITDPKVVPQGTPPSALPEFWEPFANGDDGKGEIITTPEPDYLTQIRRLATKWTLLYPTRASATTDPDNARFFSVFQKATTARGNADRARSAERITIQELEKAEAQQNNLRMRLWGSSAVNVARLTSSQLQEWVDAEEETTVMQKKADEAALNVESAQKNNEVMQTELMVAYDTWFDILRADLTTMKTQVDEIIVKPLNTNAVDRTNVDDLLTEMTPTSAIVGNAIAATGDDIRNLNDDAVWLLNKADKTRGVDTRLREAVSEFKDVSSTTESIQALRVAKAQAITDRGALTAKETTALIFLRSRYSELTTIDAPNLESVQTTALKDYDAFGMKVRKMSDNATSVIEATRVIIPALNTALDNPRPKIVAEPYENEYIQPRTEILNAALDTVRALATKNTDTNTALQQLVKPTGAISQGKKQTLEQIAATQKEIRDAVKRFSVARTLVIDLPPLYAQIDAMLGGKSVSPDLGPVPVLPSRIPTPSRTSDVPALDPDGSPDTELRQLVADINALAERTLTSYVERIEVRMANLHKYYDTGMIPWKTSWWDIAPIKILIVKAVTLLLSRVERVSFGHGLLLNEENRLSSGNIGDFSPTVIPGVLHSIKATGAVADVLRRFMATGPRNDAVKDGWLRKLTRSSANSLSPTTGTSASDPEFWTGSPYGLVIATINSIRKNQNAITKWLSFLPTNEVTQPVITALDIAVRKRASAENEWATMRQAAERQQATRNETGKEERTLQTADPVAEAAIQSLEMPSTALVDALSVVGPGGSIPQLQLLLEQDRFPDNIPQTTTAQQTAQNVKSALEPLLDDVKKEFRSDVVEQNLGAALAQSRNMILPLTTVFSRLFESADEPHPKAQWLTPLVEFITALALVPVDTTKTWVERALRAASTRLNPINQPVIDMDGSVSSFTPNSVFAELDQLFAENGPLNSLLQQVNGYFGDPGTSAERAWMSANLNITRVLGETTILQDTTTKLRNALAFFNAGQEWWAALRPHAGRLQQSVSSGANITAFISSSGTIPSVDATVFVRPRPLHRGAYGISNTTPALIPPQPATLWFGFALVNGARRWWEPAPTGSAQARLSPPRGGPYVFVRRINVVAYDADTGEVFDPETARWGDARWPVYRESALERAKNGARAARERLRHDKGPLYATLSQGYKAAPPESAETEAIRTALHDLTELGTTLDRLLNADRVPPPLAASNSKHNASCANELWYMAADRYGYPSERLPTITWTTSRGEPQSGSLGDLEADILAAQDLNDREQAYRLRSLRYQLIQRREDLVVMDAVARYADGSSKFYTETDFDAPLHRPLVNLLEERENAVDVSTRADYKPDLGGFLDFSSRSATEYAVKARSDSAPRDLSVGYNGALVSAAFGPLVAEIERRLQLAPNGQESAHIFSGVPMTNGFMLRIVAAPAPSPFPGLQLPKNAWSWFVRTAQSAELSVARLIELAGEERGYPNPHDYVELLTIVGDETHRFQRPGPNYLPPPPLLHGTWIDRPRAQPAPNRTTSSSPLELKAAAQFFTALRQLRPSLLDSTTRDQAVDRLRVIYKTTERRGAVFVMPTHDVR